MKILNVEYGHFPEARFLNKNFSESSKKLRIVLETSFENSLTGTPQRLNLEDFYPYFETLRHHGCGQSVPAEENPVELVHHAAETILSVDSNIDIAHYMEHMILDLLYQLGKSEQLSGATLPISGEVDKYVTYVECEDLQNGVFSINLVLALLHQALYSGKIDPRYRHVIRLAQWLTDQGFTEGAVEEFRKRFELDDAAIHFCVRLLNALQFSERQLILNAGNEPGFLSPVLIIEDDDLVRQTIADSLEGMGFHVHVAADGAAGLAILHEYVIGAVVIDVNLPDVSGIAIAKCILESQPSLVVVLTSGHISVPDGGELINGTVRFLNKPFEPRLLAEVLNRSYS